MVVDPLKKLLAKHGDTQGFLARFAGVSQQFISDVLSGKRSLSVDLARRLPPPYRQVAIRALAQEMLATGRSLLKEAGK